MIDGILLCAGAVILFVIVGWIAFAIKFAGPAAPLLVHPDDSYLVTNEDVSWFAKTSEKTLRALFKQDEATRLAAWDSLQATSGLTAEVAAQRVRKSFPTYYVFPDDREAPFFEGEDARLPAAIKDKVSSNVFISFIQ